MLKQTQRTADTTKLHTFGAIRAAQMRLLCGVSELAGHAGEILQGQFSTQLGPRRALVTLPCEIMRSRVSVEITGDGIIRTEPEGLTKAAEAARRALDYIGRIDDGAVVRVSSNIPLEAGLGSSTCDVANTFFATGEAAGRPFSREEVAILTVEIEKASDSTMFDPSEVRLFAQRHGVTLELLEGTLPGFEVIVITDGRPVNTEGYRAAEYSRVMIRRCDLLLDGLRAGVARGDPAAVAEVATGSATLNEAFLPKPRFRTWMKLVERYNALGLAVSHSGNAVSFLFSAEDERRSYRIHELISELDNMRVRPLARYMIGASGAGRRGA
jgi:uncharacterized protein involved in propanediol utilization